MSFLLLLRMGLLLLMSFIVLCMGSVIPVRLVLLRMESVFFHLGSVVPIGFILLHLGFAVLVGLLLPMSFLVLLFVFLLLLVPSIVLLTSIVIIPLPLAMPGAFGATVALVPRSPVTIAVARFLFHRQSVNSYLPFP